MKYYILYNYRSALEATVFNFSHSSMITPRPLLRLIISVLVLSTESVSDLSLGGENPYLYHFDVDALSNGRFNRIPFQYKIIKYYYHNPFLNLKKHPKIFVQLTLQTSKKRSSKKGKDLFLVIFQFFTGKDPVRKARYTNTTTWVQRLGQSSETIFLLMEILMSNLKLHLI